MAKKSKEEVLKALTAYIGEDTGDSAISLLEDVTDSFEVEDVTSYISEIADLKAKNEEIERTWRERYKARFTDYTPQTVPDDDIEVSVLESEESAAMTDSDVVDLF